MQIQATTVVDAVLLLEAGPGVGCQLWPDCYRFCCSTNKLLLVCGF
jgi:heme A synthase